MGTSASVAFAHLGMLERELMQQSELQPLFFARLLDDGFMIWTHGRHTLDAFLNAYNTSRERISIKSVVDNTTVKFLDVVISKDFIRMGDTVSLMLATHQKPLSRYLYLPFTSHHPRHVYKGLIMGELKRYVITNSYEHAFEIMKDKFFARLARRGYTATYVQAIAKKVQYAQRHHYLYGNTSKAKQCSLTPRFITDFSAYDVYVHAVSVLRTVVDRHRHKPQVFDLFGEHGSVDVVYRHGVALFHHLVNARH